MITTEKKQKLYYTAAGFILSDQADDENDLPRQIAKLSQAAPRATFIEGVVPHNTYENDDAKTLLAEIDFIHTALVTAYEEGFADGNVEWKPNVIHIKK